MIELKKELIYEHLKREILDRILFPGMRLPTEKELSRRLNVGQVTLRSALARLENEKLVVRIRGKGTFVCESSFRKTFLLILPDGTETLETPSRYIAEGLSTAAQKNQVTLERCPETLLKNFSLSECREMINRNHISGVILETGHRRPSPELVRKIQQFELPAVIPHGLPGDAENTGFLVLRTDEREAFSQGLLTLKELGHRRIAFLRINIEGEDSDNIRGFTRQSLLDFYRRHDLDADGSLLTTAANRQESISAAVKKWMRSSNPPTALICHSDRIAMRAFSTLRELKIKVPEQLSLMGYSNYPGSQLMLPALSTIDIHFQKCGEIAIEQLCNAEKWYSPDRTPDEIFTPFELILRESTPQLK